MRFSRPLTAVASAAVALTLVPTWAAADPFDLDGEGSLEIGGGELWYQLWDGDCSPGVVLGDAYSETNGDAFDDAGQVSVDGEVLVDDDGIVDLTDDGDDSTVTVDTQVVSDLETELTFRTFGDQGLLRQLVVLTNSTAEPVTVTVAHSSNWGADDSTVLATSSGDGDLTTADRWLVATEGSEDPAGDTIPAVVFSGPGDVEAAPTGLVDSSSYDCAGTEGATATYEVTVPAGASKGLMWFFVITDPGTEEEVALAPAAASAAPSEVFLAATISEAVARMAMFDATPAIGSELLAGVADPTILANWDYAVPVTPETPAAPPAAPTAPSAPAPAAQPVPASPAFTG